MSRDLVIRATYTLLRLIAALIFLQSGGTKLFGWLGGMPAGVTLEPWSQVWIGGVLEVIGGLLLMVGLFTRFVAFIASGEMAVAYFQFHQPSGTWPTQNNGVPAVLLCFIFLYMAARGAGEWSLDGILWGRRKRTGVVVGSYSAPDPES